MERIRQRKSRRHLKLLKMNSKKKKMLSRSLLISTSVKSTRFTKSKKKKFLSRSI